MKQLFENWTRYLKESEDMEEGLVGVLAGRHLAGNRDDEWYDPEGGHETMADRKFADRPTDDPTPDLQRGQDEQEGMSGSERALNNKILAGFKEVLDAHLGAVNYNLYKELLNAAEFAKFSHMGASAEVGGQTVYAKS